MKRQVYTMKKETPSLKEISLSAIRHILITQYDVPDEVACRMMEDSGIEMLFDKDAEMAAHTSYRTWAQRVYDRTQNCEVSAEMRA